MKEQQVERSKRLNYWLYIYSDAYHNHCRILSSALRLVKRVFVDTFVLLRCWYAFVPLILEYCNPVWGSAAECHLQLLKREVYSVARLSFIRLSCRCVIDVMLLHCVCCTRLIRTRIIVCSMSFHLHASVRVRHTRAAVSDHPLEFEVSRCRTSQFAGCFLPAQTRVWNDLPYTVFDTETY